MMSLLLASIEVRASSVLIVAIGADNTAGKETSKRRGGISQAEAYRAQLETMRARGLDAHIANEGAPHDTTTEILARLDSAVPDGTRTRPVLRLPVFFLMPNGRP